MISNCFLRMFYSLHPVFLVVFTFWDVLKFLSILKKTKAKVYNLFEGCPLQKPTNLVECGTRNNALEFEFKYIIAFAFSH